MQFDTSRQGFQGNAAVGNLLRRLALRNPQHEFVIIGKNDGCFEALPNVTNPWAGRRQAAYSQAQGQPLREIDEVLDFERSELVPLIEKLDGVVMHVGQHGTSHMPIPPSGMTWAEAEQNMARRVTGGKAAGKESAGLTTPFVWARNYGSYLVQGLNALGDRTDGHAPVTYICEDSRNYLKARDIKWPTGTTRILSQYAYSKDCKHERFHDTRTPQELGFSAEVIRNGELWLARHTYVYGGIEMMILPDDLSAWGPKPFEEREVAGIATTSHARGRPADRRSVMVRDYLLRAFPTAEVWGKWDDGSMQDVPEGTVRLNDPTDFASLLGSWRVTLVLPGAGSDWVVAKPWQAFASRTVAFHVGRVDAQGWVIPSRRAAPGTHPVGMVHGKQLYSVRDDWSNNELALARWLRVETPEELEKAARAVAGSQDLWKLLVDTQLSLLERRRAENLTESMIEDQLGL